MGEIASSAANSGRLAVLRTLVTAAVLGWLTVAVGGCGLHLHRPSDAKQARTTSDTFKELKLDAAIVTARTNLETLTTAELETRKKFGQMLVRRDLLSVIAFAPVGASDESLPRGWPKLVKETGDALGKYGLVAGDPPEFAKDGVGQLRLITRRLENADNLALELRVYDSLVKTYTLPGKAATQKTDCAQVPPLSDLPSQKPDLEDSDEWDHYRTHIVAACERVRKARSTLDEMEKVLQRDQGYRLMSDEIRAGETALKTSEAQAKELAERYAKAKKDLADAEDRLSKATVGAQTEEAKKRVDTAKADVTKGVKALNEALDAAKSVPLLDVIVKSDLLAEVIANAKFLSGDAKSPAHETTKEFVAALNRYPDIAGRLRAASEPGVNVFILELALQRLEYEKLVGERATTQDVLALRKAKRETQIEAAAAWGRIMEYMKSPDFPDAVRKRLKSDRVAEVLSDGQSPLIRQAVLNYVAAKLLEEVDLTAFDIRLADRYYRMSLDFSETALHARSDLIRAPLQEITVYHEGGIRPEEVAALLHAIGLGVIGAGVNR